MSDAIQSYPMSHDNGSLSRKEGWAAFVDAPPRPQPELLTRRQIRSLGEGAAEEYNDRRAEWHANLGPLETPQLRDLHADLWAIVGSNRQDAEKAKAAVAVQSHPGLGKTIGVEYFGKDFHRREVRKHGKFTANGHERWPVCFVGLTGRPTLKDFNKAMLTFFAHPSRKRVTTTEIVEQVLDLMIECETRVLIIDDLHFLNAPSTDAAALSNQLKYIANAFPVTLISVGVDLKRTGLLSEGTNYKDAVFAQTARRTTLLTMRPFNIENEHGRREWRQMLLTLERYIVLAGKAPGMLANELPEYLFGRSTGHIGSLMTLINRGCLRATGEGSECLTKKLLERVKIDIAAEQARPERQFALEAGRLNARPAARR